MLAGANQAEAAPENFDKAVLPADYQAQLQAQAFAMAAQQFSGGMPGSQDEFQANLAAMYGMDMGNDEEYISDEEFQKSLSDQEKTIFNALVISINQTHMNRQKNFQKRRMNYLEQVGATEQYLT